MFDFLDMLRKKPEAVRMRVALLTALGITVVIFLIWLSLLGARFGTGSSVSENTFDESGRSPLEALKEGITGTFEEGKEQLETVRGLLSVPEKLEKQEDFQGE